MGTKEGMKMEKEEKKGREEWIRYLVSEI